MAKTTQPLLATPWILDLDTTVKCLYGKQEGALLGYNPKKAPPSETPGNGGGPECLLLRADTAKIPWIAERVVTKMKLFTLKKMVYRGWADTFPQQEQMTGSGSPIAEEARGPDSIDIVSY